jgi:hypothetical protein
MAADTCCGVTIPACCMSMTARPSSPATTLYCSSAANSSTSHCCLPISLLTSVMQVTPLPAALLRAARPTSGTARRKWAEMVTADGWPDARSVHTACPLTISLAIGRSDDVTLFLSDCERFSCVHTISLSERHCRRKQDVAICIWDHNRDAILYHAHNRVGGAQVYSNGCMAAGSPPSAVWPSRWWPLGEVAGL